MNFSEWEDELRISVRDSLGVELSETNYDRSAARRAHRDGDSPSDFMEASIASPDSLDEETTEDIRLELGIRS